MGEHSRQRLEGGSVKRRVLYAGLSALFAIILLILIVATIWLDKTVVAAIAVAFTALLFVLLLRQAVRIERGEARFQTMFRSSPVPTAIFTLEDGRCLDANSAFVEMCGYTREELIGKTSVEMGLWSSPERRAAGIQELLDKGTVRQREAPFRRRSGELGFGLSSVQLVESDGHRRVLLMTQDITERRVVQDELKRLSERLVLATQSANLGIWDWDVVGDKLEWDETLYRIYGVAKESFTADFDAWASTLYPDDRDAALAHMTHVLDALDVYDIEFRIRRPDGEVRNVKALGRLQRDRDGRPIRLTGINFDVTDQRRALEVVSRGQALLLATVNTTDDAIVAVDRDLRVTMMNESLRIAVRKYFGFEPAIGMEAWRLLVPERHEEVRQIFARVLAGERQRAESTFRTAAGDIRYADELYNPILDADGKVIGVSVFVRDVSVRRHAEQTIHAVVKGTSAALGEQFFRSLVLELAAALGARCAFVGELTGTTPERVKTVAMCDAGRIADDAEYPLAGTPCAEAIGSGMCFFARDVQKHFPDDPMLADRNIESYVGVGLTATSGRPLGILAVMHDQPMRESALGQTILSIFAARAVAELERLQAVGAQKHADQALRAREEGLRLAQQIGNVGSWERDLHNDTVSWSEQMYRIAGQSPETFEVSREAWHELVHPDDLPRLLATSEDAIAGRRAFSIDHRIRLEDGTFRHVHERAEVVRDEAGRPLRLVGTVHDITERKQAEEALRRSERSFRQLVESTAVIPWTAQPEDFRFTYVGPQAVEVLGYPLAQWYEDRFWIDHMHPDDREWVLRKSRSELQQGHDTELEYRMLTSGGRVVWLREIFSAMPGEDGADSLQGFLFDITDEKRAEEQLRLAGEVFQSSGEAIVITDSDMRIVSINPAFATISGYTAEEAVGQTPYSLSPGIRSQEREREIWERVWHEGFWQGEVWDRRRNGDVYPKWLTVSVVRDANGRPVNYIEIFSDISERKEREERVRHLAHHDFLTDLPNRVLLNDRITQAISLAERNRTQVAVMFLDLDRFKNVNDSLGHTVGDKLLQEVGRRLRGSMRASDTVSRQGGDEFVILMPDVDDAADIARRAQSVLDSVSSPYAIDGHELVTTPSIGISVFPSDGRDVETLLKNADAAMYHAKESGRNNYQFFTQDMNTRALERLSLERSLRRAVERGELRLHYQPQYDVRNGRIVGLEALIRWEHPDLGLLAPGKFMSFAEDTGLILPVGEWVLREACRQNRAWQNQGLPAVRVAVNISPLQFRNTGFTQTVQAALSDTGLESRWLELEVTESVIMEDAEGVTVSLQHLKSLGLDLAIDDFGTGYSSLSYLKRFPIDKLKIDQSFVRDITFDKDDAAITSAIIGLTRNLGLRTIAEGVETREQLEFLQLHGCDEAQGFLFSKPLTAEECGALLLGSQTTRREPRVAQSQNRSA